MNAATLAVGRKTGKAIRWLRLTWQALPREALINSRVPLALGRVQQQGAFVKAGWLPVERTQREGRTDPKALRTRPEARISRVPALGKDRRPLPANGVGAPSRMLLRASGLAQACGN